MRAHYHAYLRLRSTDLMDGLSLIFHRHHIAGSLFMTLMLDCMGILRDDPRYSSEAHAHVVLSYILEVAHY